METRVNFPQKEKKNRGKRVERVFEVGATLECGQCFRWERGEQGYTGIAFGRRLHIWEEGDEIIFDSTPEDFENIWYKYFDLGTDYEAIREELCRAHPKLREMAEFAPGIRILRQESWETLVTFLLSQNNNIPRIKGIVRRLCEGYGSPMEGGFRFPPAERVAELSEEALKEIGSGFRAKYIQAAARMAADGEIDLNAVSTMELGEAREKLQTIPGVGPKVAECILLYGMHRMEAFPMDVWMKRAMEEFFPGERPEVFGEYAGIAQQYIYHYSRLHKERFRG